MPDRVSPCCAYCGGEMERGPKEKAGVDDNGTVFWYWGWICPRCHKPVKGVEVKDG